MSSRHESRLARLEAKFAPPAPDLVERVAAKLDRLGEIDPERANDLCREFGLEHRYPADPDPFDRSGPSVH